MRLPCPHPTSIDRATLVLLAALLALVSVVPGCGGSEAPNDGISSSTMLVETLEYAFHENIHEAEQVEQDPERPIAPGRFETTTKKAAGKLYRGGEQPALVMTPPARATFTVDAPANARLSFSAGIAKQSQRFADEVRFEVLVDGEPIFDRVLAPEREPDAKDWVPFELTLDKGGPTSFTFRTSFPNERSEDDLPVLCGFGEPQLTTEKSISRTSASREKPNLLYVVVDTVRADHLGCYGHDRDTSPRLDALAESGLRYEAPVSAAPWTWPATASLLTGLPPLTHGVIFADSCFLPSDAETIAEKLQDDGVTTFAVSANSLVCRPQNFDQGFEFFEEAFHDLAGDVTDRFLSWLDDHGDHRFFAYLHYYDPHYPYDPPDGFRYVDAARGAPVPPAEHASYDAMRKMEDGGVRGYLEHEDRADAIRELYDGEIRYFDEHFGRMLDDLERRGLLENTIVVVTSDHGEEFFDHGRVGHSIQLHDELLVVPLILWYPPRIPNGVVKAQVATEWLPATLLDLMGVRPPGVLRERLPLTPDPASESPAFATTERWRDPQQATRHRQASIRTSRWKLISVPEPRTVREGGESRTIVEPDRLFDLVADPSEQRDVAAANRDIVEELRAKLDTWLERTLSNSLKRGVGEVADESAIERLRRLGYLPPANESSEEDADTPGDDDEESARDRDESRERGH